MQKIWVPSLENGMATYSSIPAWEIPWTEEPGGLQSMGLQRVERDWTNIYSHMGQYASHAGLVVKNVLVNPGDMRDASSTPRWVKSPGEGHDNPLQYFSLENPMDRGAWWATVHGVTKSQIGLRD